METERNPLKETSLKNYWSLVIQEMNLHSTDGTMTFADIAMLYVDTEPNTAYKKNVFQHVWRAQNGVEKYTD